MTQNAVHHKGRPREYRGPLSPEQVAVGMNAAERNARRLASDARLLLDAGRLPTAAALAALSIEESGKSSILRGLAVATSPEEIRDGWQQYRDHRSKNGFWILPDLAKAGARMLSDFRSLVDRDAEHTALLNSLKQIGLYTDCFGVAHWSDPDQIFEGKEGALAEHLVSVAELLAREKQTTAREIELWIEHLRPVWRTPEMPHGLLRFADAMHREGLSDTSAEEFARFVFSEPEISNRKSDPSLKH